MKLKLIQTGGIAGLTKSSQQEIDLSEKEVDELVNSLTPEDKGGVERDSISHVLIIGDRKGIHFSPEATHGKWKATIDQMLLMLEYERRGNG